MMRLKYRKAVGIVIGLQTMMIWYYMTSHPGDSVGKHTDLNPHVLNTFTQHVHLTKTNQVEKTTTQQTKPVTKILHVTNGDCMGMVYPAHLLEEETWSLLDETKTAYVFSAYIVNEAGKIKVVGASTGRTLKVYCQYWQVMQGNDSVVMYEQPSTIHILPESHGNKYSGAIFICPTLPTKTNYISLVTSKCKMPLHLLKVKNGMTPFKYERKFTVCLKPLHFRYGRAYELVEWIEFNKILGAGRIIVYNYSTAVNTDKVLEHYEKDGILEVVLWNLPIKSYTWPKTSDPVEIHSIGMLPMLQDCLLRARSHSEFVINSDVDEFIIPRSNNVSTWSELITKLPSGYDTYIFRNTFFRKEWDSSSFQFPNKAIAQKLNIVPLQHFQREDRIFAPRSRSKYMTKTSQEDKSLMIHEVSGSNSFVVPVNTGILHHYRNWENYKDTSKRIVDKTVLEKYGEKLINKVEERWKQIADVKLDIPI